MLGKDDLSVPSLLFVAVQLLFPAASRSASSSPSHVQSCSLVRSGQEEDELTVPFLLVAANSPFSEADHFPASLP